jgi:hypothetical protein
VGIPENTKKPKKKSIFFDFYPPFGNFWTFFKVPAVTYILLISKYSVTTKIGGALSLSFSFFFGSTPVGDVHLASWLPSQSLGGGKFCLGIEILDHVLKAGPRTGIIIGGINFVFCVRY